MVKQHLMINVEHELILKAKEAKLNLSQFMRQSLEEYFDSDNKTEIEAGIRELQYEINKANEIKDKLEERLIELDFETQATIEEIKTIPEIQGLTTEQLNDPQLLMDIVELIRKKYKKRIGISNIKDYYGE